MGEPERPTLTPEQIALQQQARADKIDNIRESVTDQTRDLLVRFGRKAFAGGGGGLGTPGSPMENAGLFQGRKLMALRARGAF